MQSNCGIDGTQPILKERVRLLQVLSNLTPLRLTLIVLYSLVFLQVFESSSVQSGHPPLERLISDYQKDEEIALLKQEVITLKQRLPESESGDSMATDEYKGNPNPVYQVGVVPK